jgi:hypothetical protein
MANQPRYALKRQAERYWALSIRLHTGHGHLPPFIFQNSHQDIISTLAIKHNRIAPDIAQATWPMTPPRGQRAI